ncbi:hypothetical protein G9A89_022968 [Geosiphon pyriformis]|nr:hypothetical protein G9A89_022968 [Geosiphon pyriformis]
MSNIESFKHHQLGTPNEATSKSIEIIDEDDDDDDVLYETGLDRIKRKCIENPFVPAGMLLTTFAILGATVGMQRGNSRMFQNMLRLRVAAQGATVIALVGGALMYRGKAVKTQ